MVALTVDARMERMVTVDSVLRQTVGRVCGTPTAAMLRVARPNAAGAPAMAAATRSGTCGKTFYKRKNPTLSKEDSV